MLNNVILVGRVVEDPQLVVTENGYRVTNILMAVQKPFRNENNEIDTDFIPVQAWMKTADVICEFVGKGSILGLKCRLQTRIVEVGELKLRSVDVIVEKVSFISTFPRSNQPPNKGKEKEEINNDVPDDLNLENQEFDSDETDKVTSDEKKSKKAKSKT